MQKVIGVQGMQANGKNRAVLGPCAAYHHISQHLAQLMYCGLHISQSETVEEPLAYWW